MITLSSLLSVSLSSELTTAVTAFSKMFVMTLIGAVP